MGICNLKHNGNNQRENSPNLRAVEIELLKFVYLRDVKKKKKEPRNQIEPRTEPNRT